MKNTAIFAMYNRVPPPRKGNARRIGLVLALGAAVVLLCCAGCLPNIRMSNTDTPTLVVVPLRAVYEAGNTINPASDLAVYRSGNGAMTTLTHGAAANGYTLRDSGGNLIDLRAFIFTTTGTVTITVTDAADSTLSAAYSVAVNSGGGALPWPAEVQVVPFKTAYHTGDTITESQDLTVYRRDISTGVMQKCEPGPGAGQFTLNYSLSSGGTRTVSVIVNDYPAAGSSTPGEYTVWVDTPPPPQSPTLAVAPLRTVYEVGNRINPVSDLAVYRSGSDGTMRPLNYAAGDYTLSTTIGGVPGVNPVTTGFTPAGSFTITVTDAADNTLTRTYTVTVNSGGAVAWPAEVQVIPFQTTYSAGASLVKATDLTVYTRKPTGEMERADAGTVSLTDGTTTAGAGIASLGLSLTAGMYTITVTVPAYSATAQAAYQIGVGVSGPSGLSAVLLAVPQRTAYGLGGVINPASDLAVYQSDTDGVMSPLSYATDYTLSTTIGGTAVDPVTTSFTPAGSFTITVTAGSLAVTYEVYVSSTEAGVEMLGFYYADHIGGTDFDGYMKRNIQGAYVKEGMPQGRIIHSVKPLTAAGAEIGPSYLVGRMDTEAVTLRLDTAGVLSFRDAFAAGPRKDLIPVETVAELKMINSNRAGKYALMANVDLLGFSSYLAQNWVPLGAYPASNAFTGVFDGGGYLLDNLKITTPGNDNGGLFGYVGGGGAVKNVIVAGEIQAKNYSGGVAGELNEGTLENCENRVNVTAGYHIGGMAGYIYGGGTTYRTLTGCRNLGTIISTTGVTGSGVGGVAGTVSGRNSTLTNCSNYGTVKKTGNYPNTGGVAGCVNNTGILNDCRNSGKVESEGENTGGVAGEVQNSCKLINCYNEGTVDSPVGRVGGVAGYVSSDITLSGCVNRAAGVVQQTGTSGDKPAGGVAGYVTGAATLTDCYNEGTVDSKAQQTGGVAGFVTSTTAILSNCSNRAMGAVTSSGQYTGGVAGYVENGGKLTNCVNAGTVKSSAAYLGGVAGYVTGAATILSNCSNTSDAVAFSTGSPSDGGGVAAYVSAATLSGCVNTGKLAFYTNTGGIAGRVEGDGKLLNCSNQGDVTGEEAAGGVAGYVIGVNSVLSGCSNSGKVEARSPANYVGGVAGRVGDAATTGGKLTGCSNTGEVVGRKTYNGGVAGGVENGGKLTDCSNRGTVSDIAGFTAESIGGVAGRVTGAGSELARCSNAGEVSQTQNRPNTGGVAGIVEDGGKLTDCTNQATGTVASTGANSGGVAGQVTGVGAELARCSNAGEVLQTGTGANSGGVAGLVTMGSELIRCSNRGTVTNTGTGELVGGVAGLITNNSTANACYNTGAVESINGYTGGVAGRVGGDTAGMESSITACYNTGAVSSAHTVGGVAGQVTAASSPISSATACYNTGPVSSSQNISNTGGVVGFISNAAVTACYNTGTVVHAGNPVPSGQMIIGQGGGDIACFDWSSSLSSPSGAEWGTGDGSGSGKYWKYGTTFGRMLPQLWYE